MFNPCALLLQRLGARCGRTAAALLCVLLACSAAAQPRESADGVIVLERARVLPQNGAADALPPVDIGLPAIGPELHLGGDGRVTLRLRFDRPQRVRESTLLAAHLPGSCGSIDLFLNGELIHHEPGRAGSASGICPQPRLFALPTPLLYQRDNRLEIELRGAPLEQVTNARRAAFVSSVAIGPQPLLARRQALAELRHITLPRMLHFALLLFGGFMLLLSRANRNVRHLRMFGLTALAWSAGLSLAWVDHLALPSAWSDLLMAALWAPATAFAIEFMLTISRRHDRRLRRLLLLQCVLLPLSLLLLPIDLRFQAASLWAIALVLQGMAVFALFVRLHWRRRRTEVWFAFGALALAATIWLIDAVSTPGGTDSAIATAWIAASPYGWATLLFAIGLRLLSVYNHALVAAERSRSSLQSRVRDITAVIERNFAQLAELRVEQMTEKERRRIAADLHDDLGAKLLTIVHTCDNERIATLGREALDEMRLSVRGLSGKPMQLGDAMADWRAETVLRLGQTQIDVDWQSPADPGDQLLPARTYVQTTRILREAVNNIIKHSGATRCEVRCFAAFGEYGMIIEDNGRGIPLGDNRPLAAGHGLSSMKHRASQLNGRCTVESSPGLGTVIHLTLPL